MLTTLTKCVIEGRIGRKYRSGGKTRKKMAGIE
jgi:hypothetical protein